MGDTQSIEADFWHVQLASGEVRYWSLEELDAAFQHDEVDARTYVLKVGETSWQRLGDLLGLDDVPPVSVAMASPAFAVAPTVAVELPVDVRASEPYGYPGALSLRPVVADVTDLDEDELAAALKPKRRHQVMIAAGAVALLALVGVGLTRASSGEPVAAAVPPPVVQTVVAAAPSEEAAASQATLSDDVKRTLLEADKARAAKAAAKAAEGAKLRTTTQSMRTPKSGNVFHKGGDRYDPLNSAL